MHCSDQCAKKARTGVNHPAWKPDGRSTTPDGYILVRTADGTWDKEHRVLMQAHLGRDLRSDEQVHHKNEDRADNRLANLLVMDSRLHQAFHMLKHSTDPLAMRLVALIKEELGLPG